MIEMKHIETFGWASAVRGMRNPMNSWDKKDSRWDGDDYIIGNKDLALMKNLASAGTDHRKFLRMITVSMDINAPLYWWKEFDTYKVGVTANSCSTMHKIQAKVFEQTDFSCEHLGQASLAMLGSVIDILNETRANYVMTKAKFFWWQMIQLLPSSYNQKRTVSLNYEVLFNMYNARKGHKLDEWQNFCKKLETLPYFTILVGGYNEEEK